MVVANVPRSGRRIFDPVSFSNPVYQINICPNRTVQPNGGVSFYNGDCSRDGVKSPSDVGLAIGYFFESR